jgi:hypothetical protein
MWVFCGACIHSHKYLSSQHFRFWLGNIAAHFLGGLLSIHIAEGQVSRFWNVTFYNMDTLLVSLLLVCLGISLI